MKLPFLDRHEETARFRRLIAHPEGSLGIVYGRRRCGKSRLLREILPPARSVYYVGDDREGNLQRAGLATEIGRLLPGFERVTYPDWDALFARWWQEARPGTVLALDEFPSLVAVARDLPSLLQKYLDRETERGVHLLLSGSSQRVGEVKWAAPHDAERLLAQLEAKARRLPIAGGREITLALWLKTPVDRPAADRVVTPRQVLEVLR